MLSLRQSLRLDAVASGGLGLLLAVLSGPAEEHLGLPVALSVGVVVFLVAGWVDLTTLGEVFVVAQVVAVVGFVALQLMATRRAPVAV